MPPDRGVTTLTALGRNPGVTRRRNGRLRNKVGRSWEGGGEGALDVGMMGFGEWRECYEVRKEGFRREER